MRLRKAVRQAQRLARLIVPVLADLVAHHFHGRLENRVLVQGALRPDPTELIEELLRLRLVARVAQIGGAQVLAVPVVARPNAILLVEQLAHGRIGGGSVEARLRVRRESGVHVVPQRLVLGLEGAGAQEAGGAAVVLWGEGEGQLVLVGTVDERRSSALFTARKLFRSFRVDCRPWLQCCLLCFSHSIGKSRSAQAPEHGE